MGVKEDVSNEPLEVEAEKEAEKECNACGWADCDCRTRASDCLSNCFASLGGGIGRYPYVFAIIFPLIWGCLSIGLIDADLVTELDEVWVGWMGDFGDEKNFYDTQNGGFERLYEMTFTSQGPESYDVFTTGALQELHKVDQEQLDFTPWYDAAGKCAASKTASTCLPPLCSWIGGQCLESDALGVKPSHMHRHAITYLWRGKEYGLREVCKESFALGTLQSMTGVRLPCSDVESPLNCFSEYPLSIPPHAIDNWMASHNVSFSDSVRRGFAYAEPCLNWAGRYASKAQMGGDTDITNATHPDDGTVRAKATRVGVMRYVLHTNNAKQFVRKWNYIMNHSVSGPIYRDLGYPENITEAEAEEIIKGWEEEVYNRLVKLKSGLQHTQMSFVNEWSLHKIVDDAATRHVEYVLIGLSLNAVIIWLYLLVDGIGLGMGAILCIACATGGTLGLAALFQMNFNALTVQLLPLVTMGQGVDDVFVLLHYFHTPRYTENIEHRMRVAYGHAGPTIFTTSLTNFVVFLIATAFPIGPAKDLAYQVAIAVVSNFMVIVFGFGAMIAIDAARVVRNQGDVFCCIEKTVEEPQWRRVVRHISKETTEECSRQLVEEIEKRDITVDQGEEIENTMERVTDAALLKVEKHMQKDWKVTTLNEAMQMMAQAMNDALLKEMTGPGGPLREAISVDIGGEKVSQMTDEEKSAHERLVNKVLDLDVTKAEQINAKVDELARKFDAAEVSKFKRNLLFPKEIVDFGVDKCNEIIEAEEEPVETPTRHLDGCTEGLLRAFGDAAIVPLPGRIALLLILLGLVGLGIYGCTELQVGLPLSYLVEKDSIEYQFFEDRASTGGTDAYYVGGIGGYKGADLNTVGTHSGVNDDTVAFSSVAIQYKFNLLFGYSINHPGNLNQPGLKHPIVLNQPGLISGLNQTSAGQMSSQDPQMLAAQDQWSMEFRKAILSIQHTNPTLSVGRWYNTTLNPNAAEVLSIDTFNLCDDSTIFSPPECVVREDIYYELLGVWCGESECYREECASLVTAVPYFNGIGSQFCGDLVLRIEDLQSTLPGTGPQGRRACDGINFHLSRFVQTVDVSDTARALGQIDEARALVDAEIYKQLGIYPYGRVFLYNEQFKNIREDYRLLLIVVTAAVTIIVSLLFLSVPMGFILGFTIACSVTCIVASITILDLHLNAASLMAILFSVRMLVQHIVLICSTFDNIQGDSRADRAVQALGRVGGPVFCGALTTFLSNASLQANDTRYLKEYFFQFHSLIVLISLFFIWTLLPVLLAFFGPSPLPALTVDKEFDPVVDDKPQPVPVVSVEDLPDVK